MFYKKKELIDKAEIFFIDMLHKHVVSFEPTNSPSNKNLQGKQVLVELKLIGIDKANIWQVALDVIEELHQWKQNLLHIFQATSLRDTWLRHMNECTLDKRKQHALHIFWGSGHPT